MKRRSFLIGLSTVLATPAIVEASNIMRVARLRRIDFDRRQPYSTGNLFGPDGEVAGMYWSGWKASDPGHSDFGFAIHSSSGHRKGIHYGNGTDGSPYLFTDNVGGSQREIERLLWRDYPELHIIERASVAPVAGLERVG
jgi:hypothetical protein